MIKFNGRSSKILIKHKICGRILEIIFGNFIYRKNGCKFCNGRKIDEKKCKEMIYNSNHEYKMIGNFSSIKDKVEIYHSKCKNTFLMTPADFIYNKYRCPHCSHQIPYTKESITNKISTITNEEYKCISVEFRKGYKPKDSKVNIIHTKCGNTFSCITHNFINNGQRCPYCKDIKMFNPSFESKGAKKIREFLEKNNIIFIKEKKFDDLISPFSNKKLRFDFFIEDRNIAIEYDGKQHYKFNHTSSIMNEEAFIKTKQRDKIKNEYCKNKGIELIRIPYFDFDNIETILTERLLKE